MIARVIGRILAIARWTPVRIAVALCGAAAVALILRGLGWSKVQDSLAHAAGYLPVVFALDGIVLACSMLALRSLYGAAGRAVPVSQLVRAGLVGFAVNGLLPAGRAVAEVTRASLLARWVGSGTAAAAAARMQAVVLVAHGAMSVVATIAAISVVGWTRLSLAIGGQAIATLAIGVFLLVMASRVQIGAWLGRRVSRARVFGSALDAALESAPAIPMGAIAWELAGRCVEVVQKAVLIVAIGGALGVTPALCVEGLHLLGAAVGDLVPAQLGVQEGSFTLNTRALGLPADGALIALLAHVSQLAWVLVGSLVPLLSRAEPPAPATP